MGEGRALVQIPSALRVSSRTWRAVRRAAELADGNRLIGIGARSDRVALKEGRAAQTTSVSQIELITVLKIHLWLDLRGCQASPYFPASSKTLSTWKSAKPYPYVLSVTLSITPRILNYMGWWGLRTRARNIYIHRNTTVWQPIACEDCCVSNPQLLYVCTIQAVRATQVKYHITNSMTISLLTIWKCDSTPNYLSYKYTWLQIRVLRQMYTEF